MNNKFIARVVSVVMAVAMLGTVCFAADALNYAKTEIIVDADSYVAAQNVNTVFAFAATSASATIADAFANATAMDHIVAIEQGAKLSDIEIMAEKFTDGYNYLHIYYGGESGSVKKAVIPCAAADVDNVIIDPAADVTITELTIADGANAGTYTNLIAAEYTFTADEIAAFRSVGALFNLKGQSKQNAMTVQFGAAEISGSGTYTAMVGFAGVPAEDLATGFEATKIYQQFIATADAQ